MNIDKKQRKAVFIKPLNTLRAKVGYGGLNDNILDKAQTVLENNSVDFLPMAEMYLSGMMQGIERAGNPAPGDDDETLIVGMSYPAMQLKANGGMFSYSLVSRIGDMLIELIVALGQDVEIAIRDGLLAIRRGAARRRIRGRTCGPLTAVEKERPWPNRIVKMINPDGRSGR
jgi:hypothetical protein